MTRWLAYSAAAALFLLAGINLAQVALLDSAKDTIASQARAIAVLVDDAEYQRDVIGVCIDTLGDCSMAVSAGDVAIMPTGGGLVAMGGP